MKQLVVLALLVVGCAGTAKQPTIGGNDLFTRASELREQGRVVVQASNQQPVEVRLEHFLITRSSEQVFHVREVVAGCHGNSLAEDTECTMALLRDQRFVVSKQIPQPRQPDQEGSDISSLNKARIVLVAAGTAMAIGATKCDVFEGCKGLLGLGAGANALLLLLTYTGVR